MTRDISLFSTISKKDGGHVTFGDNAKGKIIGIGDIDNNSHIIIENVLLVDSLKHNLLNISQLCDKGFKVIFEPNSCTIENMNDGKTSYVGNRDANVCTIDVENAVLSKSL